MVVISPYITKLTIVFFQKTHPSVPKLRGFKL